MATATSRTHPKPAGASPARAALEPGVEYLRVDRVARYLDLSRKRVYFLIQEGRLHSLRFGPRQIRIPRASLESYLASLHAADLDE